ncbi:MAG: DUF4214 domain-containing protein [Pseudomonadota bacterium]
MTDAIQIPVQRYELVDDFVFLGEGIVEIDTEATGFTIGNPNPGVAITITDVDGGETFAMGTLNILRWTQPDGSESIVGSFAPDASSGLFLAYTFLISGDPLPVPQAGQELGAFLIANGIDQSFPTLEDGSGFSIGTPLRFDRIESAIFPEPEVTPLTLAETVVLVYEAGLDRDGDIDSEGLNFWIDAAQAGLSEQEIAAFFLASDEFAEGVGDPDSLDNIAFTRTLFENVLDREADQEGLDFWVSVLAQPDVDRADLLLEFARSEENQQAFFAANAIVEQDDGTFEVVSLEQNGFGDPLF